MEVAPNTSIKSPKGEKEKDWYKSQGGHGKKQFPNNPWPPFLKMLKMVCPPKNNEYGQSPPLRWESPSGCFFGEKYRDNITKLGLLFGIHDHFVFVLSLCWRIDCKNLANYIEVTNELSEVVFSHCSFYSCVLCCCLLLGTINVHPVSTIYCMWVKWVWKA